MLKHLKDYFNARKEKAEAKIIAKIDDLEARHAEIAKMQDPAEKILAFDALKAKIKREKWNYADNVDMARRTDILAKMALIGSIGVGLTGVALSFALHAPLARVADIEIDLLGLDTVFIAGAALTTTGTRRMRSRENLFTDGIRETEDATRNDTEAALGDKNAIVNSVFFLDMLEARPDLKDEFLKSMQKTVVSSARKPQPKNLRNDAHV